MEEEQDYVPSSQLDSQVKHISFFQQSLKGLNRARTKCAQVDLSALLKNSFKPVKAFRTLNLSIQIYYQT